MDGRQHKWGVNEHEKQEKESREERVGVKGGEWECLKREKRSVEIL